MKKSILFLVLLQSLLIFAQAPQKMTYQSVVRNSANVLLANQAVGVRISILEGSLSGTAVYSETHTVTTNANGLFTLEAGGGTPTEGVFADIVWGNGAHYIKSEIDPAGGTNYTLSATKELLSVPYALNGITTAQADAISNQASAITAMQAQIAAMQDQISVLQKPQLTTAFMSEVTGISAVSGGTITSIGLGDITARGVVWSTSTSPTIALNTKTIDDSGTGSFTSAITELNANTTYYVRSYATNSFGTSYGAEVSFTTMDGVIVLATNQINNVTPSSANSGGEITSDGGATITARGIVWSTSSNPTITLATKTINGSGIGSFSSDIIGLITGTTYYVRAYATNSFGTVYGTEKSFTTILTTTIGLHPELGGYVFSLSADGQHGLVAETQDQGLTTWYEAQNLISNPTTHSAAGQQFTDWRLPFISELTQMFNNRLTIGGFSYYGDSSFYWSRSEYNETKAYNFYFNPNYGSSGADPKASIINVRAVREF